MMSEKRFAEYFNGYWSEALPLLTPAFVRIFNEASRDELSEYAGAQSKRIPIHKAIEKHDLVAELSFQLAKYAYEISVPAGQLAAEPELFNVAYQNSLLQIPRYKPEDDQIILKEEEISEAITIALQYPDFFSRISAKDITFSPEIDGSGFIGLCKADLSIDNTLYEVKAVTRNIAGKDIKQLLTYLALQYSTGNRKWTHCGFYNPRRALHFRHSIDHLIYRTSGGRGPTEVFNDMIEFLGSREIELDSIF